MNKFSKKDLESIIKLASQIEQTKQKKKKTDVFLWEEVEEIARNCGISSESLQLALNNYIKATSGINDNFNSSLLSIEKVLPAEIDNHLCEIIISTLRDHYKSHGFFSQINDSYEWSTNFRKKDNVHVSIKKSKDCSILRIKTESSALKSKTGIISSLLGFILFAIGSSYLNLDSISTNFYGSCKSTWCNFRLFSFETNCKASTTKKN